MNKRSTLVGMGILAAGLIFISCNKENDAPASLDGTSASLSVPAISVAVNVSGDSVYVVNACSRGGKLYPVELSGLPGAIPSYLQANYSGYTFQKAFSADSAGAATGYVVVIGFNGKPVGLKFDAAGNFIKVLEQREVHDLGGHNGWHKGGLFDGRGDGQKDTVALKNLPVPLLQYMAATYAQDTLAKAYANRDGSLVVLSMNNGVYATVFSAAGLFIKRTQLPPGTGRPAPVALNELPLSAQAYLSATYPNFVFKQAFSVRQGTTTGYLVFLDANNTKYAVAFDAQGNVVKTLSVR